MLGAGSRANVRTESGAASAAWGGSGGEPAGLGRPPEGALGPLCHFSSTVLIILIMREQSVEEVGGGSSGVKWLGFRGDSDARAEEQQRLRGARGDRSEPASRPARMGLGGAGQQTAGEVRSSRIPGRRGCEAEGHPEVSGPFPGPPPEAPCWPSQRRRSCPRSARSPVCGTAVRVRGVVLACPCR